MPAPEDATASQLCAAVAAYPALIPDSLQELDHYRLDTIPALLAERNQESNPHLTKAELLKLVEWKLKHGTFRPSLLALVRSSADTLVEQVIHDAFSRLAQDSDLSDPTVLSALDTLCTLKGIGPATAALLMSEYAPARLPFFSDELYRWLVHCTAKDTKAQWVKATIKYTKPSYASLLSKGKGLLERLSDQDEQGRKLGMLDLEMAAYVFARSDGTMEKAPVSSKDGKESKRPPPIEDETIKASRNLRSSKRKRHE